MRRNPMELDMLEADVKIPPGLIDQDKTNGVLLDSVSEARRSIVRAFLHDNGIDRKSVIDFGADKTYVKFVDALVLFIGDLFNGTPEASRERVRQEARKSLPAKAPEISTQATPPSDSIVIGSRRRRI